jgi:Flp pilus assembly protein TadG
MEIVMRQRTSPARRDSGQVLVIFALALVAIVAMTGLVLDGGSTFVQRRDMQNIADSAAMSAGYSYANGGDSTAVTAAARSTAASNGYVHGANGVSVTVSLDAPGGAGRHLTVTISKPHQNNFAGIVGMSTWQVTTTAMTLAGRPNAVLGAMPIIFNIKAFGDNGAGPGHEVVYDEPAVGSNDVPLTSTSFNWTMWCNLCNANSNTVDDLINGGGTTTTVTLADKISPLNAGSHTTLYSDLSSWVGGDFPVPIVDDAGDMVGWAMVHLTGSVGGSTKEIRGYFESPINPVNMTIVDTADAGGDYGAYIVKLVN